MAHVVKAYTVQVERMRSTRSVRCSGEADLDRRVDGQLVQATSRHEVLSTLCTADDLEKDGDSGGNERGVVDEEVGAIEVEDHVDGLVYTTLHRATRLDESPMYRQNRLSRTLPYE